MDYKKWHKKRDDEFEYVVKDKKEYCIGEMLHGHCDIFAIQLGRVLKEKNIPFQYCILSSEDEGLIHCFLYVCDENIHNNTELAIDVRGITDDFEEFFDEFADFFSYRSWAYYDTDEATISHYNTERRFKNALSIIYGGDLKKYFSDKEILDKADAIIRTFEDYYIP